MIGGLTLYHYLFVGLILFLTGLSGSIFCKNVIKVLISIEFILTGVNINFAAFSAFCGNSEFDGFIFILFYTGIGAAEFAIALYIFYLMYKRKLSNDIQQYGDL